MDKLVSTDWVAEHGNDPGVRLVEIDVDTVAYEEGHIAGSISWNWTTELQDQMRRDILSKEDIEELLGRSGIDNDTRVILYGDNNNWFAAYGLWLLELYGHTNVALMDGGRIKWIAEDRPLTEDEVEVEPTDYTAKDPDPALRALREQVLSAVGEGGVQLVDVRSPAEYTGQIIAPPGMSETAQRAGHIPGAINMPWARAVNEDGSFRSVEELRELYGGAGVDLDGGTPTIAYCRIGERSSHTWFVLHYLLGIEDVRNYDGSWTEYGSIINAPIER